MPVQLNRVGVFDEKVIRANDYVLIAEKDREHEASAAPDRRVNTYIMEHPESFQVAEWFPLPNGEIIRLYRVQ